MEGLASENLSLGYACFQKESESFEGPWDLGHLRFLLFCPPPDTLSP